MLKLRDDWDPGLSLNRMTWTLTNKMKIASPRASAATARSTCSSPATGRSARRTFASDLHLIFPKLNIVTISANKLLGEYGHTFAVAQFGFQFNNLTLNVKRDTLVLLISHSGGTFATLNCAHLLKALTKNIFCVSSEWDTAIARSVREGMPGKKPKGIGQIGAFTFSTFAGLRPAEPCSSPWSPPTSSSPCCCSTSSTTSATSRGRLTKLPARGLRDDPRAIDARARLARVSRPSPR